MSDSLVNQSLEDRLRWGVAWINKAKRLGLLTDVLVAASTTFQNLLDRISQTYLAVTLEDNLMHQDKEEMLGGLKRELSNLRAIKLAAGTSALSDTLIGNLSTVNTAAADTDLRHLFAKWVSDANFDRTQENVMASGVGATSY